TDVGPGPFEQSELYVFIDTIVEKLDLTLPWTKLRVELNRIVPDKSLRIMLQSQIHYPDGKPPGHWKTGMRYLSEMLSRQQIADQFEGLSTVDVFLCERNRFLHVFQASYLTGIGEDALPRMKALKSIRLYPLENASHFLHVTHKNKIVEIISSMP